MNIVVMQERHLAALAEIERACFHAPWSENMLREELGKPVGSDVQKGKTTFVTLHGVEGTRALAARTTADACDTLAANFGEASAFLCAFAQSLISRTM